MKNTQVTDRRDEDLPRDPNTTPTKSDVAIAATLMAVGLAWMPYVDQHSADDAPVSWAAFVLLVVASGVQVARRWRPVAALLVTASATAVYLAVGFPYGPITFAFALAVYSVARHRTLVPAAGWSLVAWAAFLVHLFTSDVALDGISGVGPALAWLAIPFTLGVSRRLVVEARSRERAEADHRLVDAERLRLAQEVHDVVGHGLAAIQMQADIALHVRRTRPDQTTQADEALAAISKASSEALEELRATLAEIRPEAASAEESRGPTPGIAKLDALCERVRAAGVDIDLVVVGEQRLLPPAADLAAYRILQESLTNVVKHSPHPHAEVKLQYDGDGIIVTVTNRDVEPGQYREGFGIVGMRRRATQLDGTLAAGLGPAPDTFQVRAQIPARLGASLHTGWNGAGS